MNCLKKSMFFLIGLLIGFLCIIISKNHGSSDFYFACLIGLLISLGSFFKKGSLPLCALLFIYYVAFQGLFISFNDLNTVFLLRLTPIALLLMVSYIVIYDERLSVAGLKHLVIKEKIELLLLSLTGVFFIFYQ